MSILQIKDLRMFKNRDYGHLDIKVGFKPRLICFTVQVLAGYGGAHL